MQPQQQMPMMQQPQQFAAPIGTNPMIHGMQDAMQQ